MLATCTNSSLFLSSSERHFNPCKNECFVYIRTLNIELLGDGTACLPAVTIPEAEAILHYIRSHSKL
jgi:hypothetical protein